MSNSSFIGQAITTFALSVFFLFSSPLSAESIFLKDGSIVEGTISGENDRDVIMRLAEKPKIETIPRKNILRIAYSLDYKTLKYIGTVSNDEIEGFIVDENTESYLIRNKLLSPEETTLPKKEVVYISLKSMAKRHKKTDGKTAEKDEVKTGIWKHTAAYPSVIDRHRFGILLGSGAGGSKNVFADTQTGWSGIYTGIYYQWKYIDIELFSNIGFKAMNAAALSLLGLVNVYPIPYLGFGIAYSLILDRQNEGSRSGNFTYKEANYQMIFYGFNARIWKFRLGLYAGLIIDSSAIVNTLYFNGIFTENITVQYAIDLAKSAAKCSTWLLMIEYTVIDSVTLHFHFEIADGVISLKKKDLQVAPPADQARVNMYLVELAASYAFSF